MDPVVNFTYELLWVLAAAYTATVVHELGHAEAGGLVGYRVFVVGTGHGRPVLRVRLGGLTAFAGLKAPFSGLTLSQYPSLAVPRPRQLVSLAGGVAANAAVAVVAGGVLLAGVPASWQFPIGAVFAVNALMGAVNLWPLEVKIGAARLLSDGGQILALFRGRTRSRAAEQLNVFRVVAALCDRLGETRLRRLVTLNAAMVWGMLGETDRARGLLAEAEGLGDPDHPFDRGYRHFARAVVLSDEDSPDEMFAELAVARNWYEKAGDRAGVLVTDLSGAEARMNTGRGDLTEDELRGWEADPLVRDPALGRSVELLRLNARIHAADPTAPDDLAAWFDALPEPVNDPFVVLLNFRRNGKILRDRGEYQAAERLLALALLAAGNVERGLGHDEDRETFDAVKERLRGLRAVAAASGRADTVEGADAEDERAAREAADREAARQRRLFRTGWALLAAQVAALIVVSAALGALGPPESDRQRWAVLFGAVYLLAAGLFTAVMLAYCVGVLLVRAVRPSLVEAYGKRTHTAALLLWVLPPVFAGTTVVINRDGFRPDTFEFRSRHRSDHQWPPGKFGDDAEFEPSR